MSSFQKWIPKLGTLFYVVSSFQLLPFHGASVLLVLYSLGVLLKVFLFIFLVILFAWY